MDWLWIAAVALVSIFVLALCWAFFKDYTCCPCRRRRPPVPSDDEQIPHVDTCPSISIDIDDVPRAFPKPPRLPHVEYTFSIDVDDLPRALPKPSRLHRPYIQPPEPPPRPARHYFASPYSFGNTVDEDSVVEIKNGVPTLDLHGLRVREARYVTKTFLQQSRGRFRHVRIITGRGLHSIDGVPKIKPEVELLLSGYNYKVTAMGGCYEINL